MIVCLFALLFCVYFITDKYSSIATNSKSTLLYFDENKFDDQHFYSIFQQSWGLFFERNLFHSYEFELYKGYSNAWRRFEFIFSQCVYTDNIIVNFNQVFHYVLVFPFEDVWKYFWSASLKRRIMQNELHPFSINIFIDDRNYKKKPYVY